MWNPLLCYAQQERKLDAEGVKAVLQQIVDEHAKAKVDRIVHCVFSLPWGTVSPGFRSFCRIPPAPSGWYMGIFHPDTETGVRQLEEAGHDLIQVLLEQSHKSGMQFLGGLRMNDRHPGSTTVPFYADHPEWQLRDLPGHSGYLGGMDYGCEGVRKAVLAFAEEFLDRYDADGIELDWMRWCHMFNLAEAEQNTPILTQFTAEMRQLLDRAAKTRGRQLLLGVRVPQTIEECRALGFDVKAWVQQELVDFVCPSDFAVTDFNTKTEQFSALTEGTQCKVYPSVHPQYVDFSLRPTPTGEYPVCHSAESYRAAAKNFHAFGADGVSAYNYQDPWVADPAEWPRALSYLTGLRSPTAVARGDRRYMYYPTSPGTAVTGAVKHETIVLDRDAAEPADSVRFRMAEDLKDPHLSATLAFKVTDMAEADEIEVALNGEVIPADRFERSRHADIEPAFHLYSAPLGSPPAKFGDNELQLRLTKSAGAETLVAREFEVLVRQR